MGITGKSCEARAWLDRLVNDPALGIAKCELAIAVVKAMIPDAEEMPRLSKTLTGLKIEQHVSSGPDHDVQSLTGLIRAWDDLQAASYKDVEQAVARPFVDAVGAGAGESEGPDVDQALRPVRPADREGPRVVLLDPGRGVGVARGHGAGT